MYALVKRQAERSGEVRASLADVEAAPEDDTKHDALRRAVEARAQVDAGFAQELAKVVHVPSTVTQNIIGKDANVVGQVVGQVTFNRK